MSGYQQFTLPQLLVLFYEQVGENTNFFRTDEATRILQEAFRVFNCFTGFWRDRIDMGFTVAGQHWYSTPAGLTYIYRVEVDEQVLQTTTVYDLDYGRPTWESETATGTDKPQAWAPAGTNLFAVWPASLAGGESLIVEGVTPAPVLTSVGFVNLGSDELEMILDEATHIAQFKEGGQEFEASQLAHQEFLRQAGERNAMLMQSAKFRAWMGMGSRKSRPMGTPDAKVGAR